MAAGTLVSHGFPDYFRRAGNSDAVYVQFSGTGAAGGDTYGPFFVGDTECINLIGHWTGGHNSGLTLSYYTDATTAHNVANQNAFFGSGVPDVQQSYRVLGPYLYVYVTPTDGISTVTYNLTVNAAADVSLSSDLNIFGVLFSKTAQSIAATTTTTFSATWSHGGAVSYSGKCNTAGTSMTLQLVSMTGGAATTIDKITDADGRQNKILYLPSTQLQVVMANPTAGAATFDCYVLADRIAK